MEPNWTSGVADRRRIFNTESIHDSFNQLTPDWRSGQRSRELNTEGMMFDHIWIIYWYKESNVSMISRKRFDQYFNEIRAADRLKTKQKQLR